MTALASPSIDRPHWRTTFERLYPGCLAAGVAGITATWLADHYAAPVMLFALLIGMAFHFLHEEGKCVAGIDFVSRSVLRIGVALLGVRITFHDIVSLGVAPVATVFVGTGSTILVGALAARWMGRPRLFGVLTGGAVGICGASAALAINSVLPRTPDSERNAILTVVTVTALSTLAMIFYPMLTRMAGFDHTAAGVFLGATIHDVAQVVGAGYTISPETGDVATYVKLLRVALLVPVVLIIATVVRRREGVAAGAGSFVPGFLVAFAVLVLLGSLGFISKPMVALANNVSRWCLVAAVAALGMKTSFKALAGVGWSAVALIVLETVWLAAVAFMAIRIAG